VTTPPPAGADTHGTSTRPYLIRALHDWCTDNGFTPYIAVYVDRSVQVPQEYVKNNEIVLNVGFEFRARFGGSARDILVPVDHVVAIYARENGQGMAFPVPTEAPAEPGAAPSAAGGLRLASTEGEQVTPEETPPEPPAGGPRPSLKRIK
jgi:stringent starvation protein B